MTENIFKMTDSVERIPIIKLIYVQVIKKCYKFCGCRSVTPCSQELLTGPSPQPQSNKCRVSG
jgi:hypothetical protein